MRNICWIFLLLCCPAAFTQPPQPAHTPSSLYVPSPLSAKLDFFFHIQPSNQPGIALSIEKNGAVIYRNTSGLADLSSGIPLDSTSNFRMASVTKQFTAMGILLLEKDGALTLDDPIRRWLPELHAGIGNRILIRHLLTHSSGLPDYESLIPPAQTRQVLDEDVLHLLSTQDTTYFPPGSQFRYSNSGFCLLALIIERASHQSFATFIREKIFVPLHMDNSAIYEPDEAPPHQNHPIPHRAMGYAKDSAGAIIPSDQSVTSATKGDGGVYTSLTDYSKWIHALQQGRPLRLPAILRRLRYPIAGIPDSYYAAGWFITGNSPVILFHSGSTCGFANFVIQIPGDEWSIVYFSNLADNTAPFRDLLKIVKDTGMEDLSPVFRLYEQTR
jgi:CubicO group peptidase (beta-lactamase class C family)